MFADNAGDIYIFLAKYRFLSVTSNGNLKNNLRIFIYYMVYTILFNLLILEQ